MPPSFRLRSFAARYLVLVGGEVSGKLCVITAFAYLARVLTPADYGIVEQALAITVFFVLAVESGMSLYGARLVADQPRRVPALVTQVMALRAVLGVVAFGAILVMATRYRMAGLGILAINGVAVLLTPFLTQWVFQGLRQMPWVATGTALRSLTFLALVLALVRPGSDVRLVAVAEVISIVILAAVNAYFLHGRLGVRLDWSGLAAGTRRVFGDVWFMGLSGLSWAGLWYSPALIAGWAASGRTEEVAWVAAAVRVVLAVHTFVYLYFFNLLPSLTTEISAGLDGWRELMRRSIAVSVWPACFVAVAGTLSAPIMIPLLYGAAFERAVLPFQIAIWMIPAAWFSGHFRFSLIAAGQQWSEFIVSSATAAVTIAAAVFLSHDHGSIGAALAFTTGGLINAVFAVAATERRVGRVPILSSIGPAIMAASIALLIGLGVSRVAGSWAATAAGCVVLLTFAALRTAELVQFVRGAIKSG